MATKSVESLTTEEQTTFRTEINAETAGAAAAAAAAAVSNAAYEEAGWNGVTTVAPSKDAVRDKFEALDNAKQPLDSDLTAFAAGAPATALGDSTAQANRRGMIGAVGTALEITTALQDQSLDPLEPTKISAAYMPDTLELDYVRPGENSGETASILPIGSLTRKSAILHYHDGETPGGIQVGGSGEAANRTVGAIISHPYATTVGGVVSTVQRRPVDGTAYYQKIGTITIPGSQFIAGNRLAFRGNVRIKSDVLGVSTAWLQFVPKTVWDTAGVLLTSGINSAYPAVRIFNQTDSYESVVDFWWMSDPMGLFVSDNTLSATSNTAISSWGQGYNVTTGAHFSVTSGLTGSLATSIFSVGSDAEFVVVLRVASAETRYVSFDISGSALPT